MSSLLAMRRPGTDRIAVRWFVDVDPAFDGFKLVRRTNGGQAETLSTGLRLPGAVTTTNGWKIDPDALARDGEARGLGTNGQPAQPYLDDPSDVQRMLPLLLFGLPAPDPDQLDAHYGTILDFYADDYAANPAFASYWQGRVPDRDALLQLAKSYPNAYKTVQSWYCKRVRDRLQGLALHFGMARFLGWGVEDATFAPGSHRVAYEVQWQSETGLQWARSETIAAGVLWSIVGLALKPEVGTIGYERFKPFFGGAALWQAVPLAGLPPALEDARERSRLGPRRQTPIARLDWETSSMEPNSPPPVLWEIERVVFDDRPPGSDPPQEPGTGYERCNGAKAFLKPTPGPDPHDYAGFLDDPNPPWGTPPRLGWRWYRIRGRDPLGIVRTEYALKSIELRDTEPPPPPGVVFSKEQIDVADGAKYADIPLELVWDAAREFGSPDAAEFRIEARLRAKTVLSVEIRDARAAPGALGEVQVDVALSRDGQSSLLGLAELTDFLGSRLLTPKGEFVVLADSPQSGYSVRVRKSARRRPPLGGASLQAIATAPSGVPVKWTESRTFPAAVLIKWDTWDPLVVKLSSADSVGSLPGGECLLLYIHALAVHWRARPLGGSDYRIELPAEGEPGYAVSKQWQELGPVRAEEAIRDSPALLLPRHFPPLSISLAPDFIAGTLELSVCTADAAGNVGPKATKSIVVRRELVPAASSQVRTIWARGAAEFVDFATADLSWPAVPHAVRYEVERVLESKLGLDRSATDRELVEEAELQPDVFERRTNHAFLARWRDPLPGRTPTRAVYRIRAVTSAEVSGPWFPVCVVRVPDVRVPAAPNLLRVAPPASARELDLEWTQPGIAEGIGFEVEAKLADSPTDDWNIVATFLPLRLAPDGAGRYRTTVAGFVPGRTYAVRVLAIRHALDPIDPRCVQRRTIRGHPSAPLAASVRGDLATPSGLSAKVGRDGIVALSWHNGDPYERIELRRRKPGGIGFERLKLEGGATRFSDREAQKTPGLWRYELFAWGAGRGARSAPIDVKVP